MFSEKDAHNHESSDVSHAIEWYKNQFESLAEERRVFDRYMWQLPVAALGIVALLLNASKAICSEMSHSPEFFRIMLAFSAFICLYAALSLCRFQARRRLREKRMEAIEGRVAFICSHVKDSPSAVTTGKQVTETAEESDRWEIRKFGKFPTTRLGIGVLILAALALFMSTLYIPQVQSKTTDSSSETNVTQSTEK